MGIIPLDCRIIFHDILHCNCLLFLRLSFGEANIISDSQFDSTVIIICPNSPNRRMIQTLIPNEVM